MAGRNLSFFRKFQSSLHSFFLLLQIDFYRKDIGDQHLGNIADIGQCVVDREAAKPEADAEIGLRRPMFFVGLEVVFYFLESADARP